MKQVEVITLRKFKVPCKECLKFPICRKRCKDLSRYDFIIKRSVEVLAGMLGFIVTAIFAYHVISGPMEKDSTKVLVAIGTSVLVTASMLMFFESNVISDFLLKRYPE